LVKVEMFIGLTSLIMGFQKLVRRVEDSIGESVWEGPFIMPLQTEEGILMEGGESFGRIACSSGGREELEARMIFLNPVKMVFRSALVSLGRFERRVGLMFRVLMVHLKGEEHKR